MGLEVRTSSILFLREEKGKVHFGGAVSYPSHWEGLLLYELFGIRKNPLNILRLLSASLGLLLPSQESWYLILTIGLIDSTGRISSPNFLPSLESGGLGKRAQVIARSPDRVLYRGTGSC